MRIIPFNTPYPARLSLALGFFDCAHAGHRAILKSAADFARETGAETAAFTFDNDPFRVLGRNTKLIYTFPERVGIFEECGVAATLAAGFSEAFMRLSSAAFLEALTRNCDIAALSCGSDYTYGFGGGGDAASLETFCARHGIKFCAVPDVKIDGTRVSSTAVRGFLTAGDIGAANRFLGAPYAARGRVEHGRGVGHRISYPTVNLSFSEEKLRPKDGVYATRTVVGGRAYASITNAGGKPTFGVDSYGIETFIIDYNKDIYGKEVKTEFLAYMRPIRKFDGPEALRAQLDADVRDRKEMKTFVCKIRSKTK
ncbi:riboflavin biosynthesis protein [Clostridia bacterium]|nr:riboflavin biosynthesis protein [Clostridia bacterium]